MGKTIVEKILSKNLGKSVYSGDEELFTPDIVAAYDYPGYLDSYEDQLTKELQIFSVKNPGKYIFFIDHFDPAGASNFTAVHKRTRKFADDFGFTLYEGKGIGHQVIAEKGHIKPGQLIVHFDGHVSTLGAFGVYAQNIRNSMIEVFATDQVSLLVPDTVRIEFSGKLQKGVAARDVYHTLVGMLGPAGCRSCVIEYGGEGLRSLNLDERLVICNLAMFMGGLTSIMETDDKVYEFLKGRVKEAYDAFLPDPDAKYVKKVSLDLDTVEPVLVAPPSPANTVGIKEYIGVSVNVGYIGSCASGRITDFTQALEILGGKQVRKGFRLMAVPSSVEIQKEIAANGMMGSLIDCGARVYYPSCDFCYGAQGVLNDGDTALSTGTLNIPGRMGNEKASIYTASPYTVAAAALNGKITDPRDFF